MRIMIDTNILISAAVLSSPHLLKMINEITERHKIVLPTYILEELKHVTERKFPEKVEALNSFLLELPYELVYTPQKIDKTKYPEIRDDKDLPILASAIFEDADVLITGDADLCVVDTQRPQILTTKQFIESYC